MIKSGPAHSGLVIKSGPAHSGPVILYCTFGLFSYCVTYIVITPSRNDSFYVYLYTLYKSKYNSK